MFEGAAKRELRGDLKRRRKEVERQLAAHGLSRGSLRLLGRTPATGSHGRRLRAALESLGPVFASFGLYLSTRVDLLPAHDCLELASIRDWAEPAMPAEVRAAVKRELGHAPEELYAVFEQRPFDSRQLFQRHRALLGDGRAVTVKLFRPEAEELLRTDVELLPLLKRSLVGSGCGERAAESAIFDFRRGLRQQTDLARQAAAQRSLAGEASEFGLLHVPAVVGRLSTTKLLTRESPDGVPLPVLLPHAPAEGTSPAAIDDAATELRRDLARRVCVIWLRQALLGNLFPVEPLPANILVLPDRSIAFTEGVLANVPSEAKANLWEYMMAAAADNPDRASFCLLKELTKGTRQGYEDDLRLRFRQIVPFRDGERSYGGEKDSLADYLFLHWRLAGERGYVPQYYLPGFYRGLFALVCTAQLLAPGQDTLAEGLRDVRLLAGIERFWEMLSPNNLGEQAERYAATMSEMPQTLDEVLTLASQGRARLGLQVPESADRHGRQNSFAVTLSVLLAFVGLALLTQLLPSRLAETWTGGLGTVVFVVLGGALLWAASRA